MLQVIEDRVTEWLVSILNSPDSTVNAVALFDNTNTDRFQVYTWVCVAEQWHPRAEMIHSPGEHSLKKVASTCYCPMKWPIQMNSWDQNCDMRPLSSTLSGNMENQPLETENTEQQQQHTVTSFPCVCHNGTMVHQSIYKYLFLWKFTYSPHETI